MKTIKIIIQSFMIGLAKITPGASGSVLAISFGLYEKGIEAISNLFFHPIKNGIFLLLTGLPIFLAMIVGSGIITFLMEHYYLPVMLLFIGMIIQGIWPIGQKIKKDLTVFDLILVLFLFLLWILLISSSVINTKIFHLPMFFIYLLIGFIDAATMVIPGVSGSALLMAMGLYPLMLECLSSFRHISLFFHNIWRLCPYLVGLTIGIFVVSFIMRLLLHTFPHKTYCMILTLSLASILLLMKEIFAFHYLLHEVILGTVFFFLGIRIGTIFES